MKIPLDVSGPKVIEPVNDMFSAILGYRTYHLIKKSARYDADGANELHWMAKKTAIQMKDRMFSGKNSRSVIAFIQDFKYACDACKMYEGATVWLFKQFSTGLAEAAVKSRICLPNSISSTDYEFFQFYSSIVQFLSKRYAKDDNIAPLDDEIFGLQQSPLAPTKLAQKLWTKKLVRGFVYDEKALKGMFLEWIKVFIRKLLIASELNSKTHS